MSGFRVVVEVPAGVHNNRREVRSETDAVRWVQSQLARLSPHRIKSYTRVVASEKLKVVGENDASTRLRQLRDQLTEVIHDLEMQKL